MIKKDECVLCNPESLLDGTLCPSCIDKAASADDLLLRLTLAGLAFRKIYRLAHLTQPPAQEPPPCLSEILKLIETHAQTHIQTTCGPELAAFDRRSNPPLDPWGCDLPTP
jgi:hypothetical protein